MELRQNMRHAKTRPMALVAAILIALATGLIGWNVLTANTHTVAKNVHNVAVIRAYPLLDRNAERQQAQTPRSGGPGGQIGDIP